MCYKEIKRQKTDNNDMDQGKFSIWSLTFACDIDTTFVWEENGNHNFTHVAKLTCQKKYYCVCEYM